MFWTSHSHTDFLILFCTSITFLWVDAFFFSSLTKSPLSMVHSALVFIFAIRVWEQLNFPSRRLFLDFQFRGSCIFMHTSKSLTVLVECVLEWISSSNIFQVCHGCFHLKTEVFSDSKKVWCVYWSFKY